MRYLVSATRAAIKCLLLAVIAVPILSQIAYADDLPPIAQGTGGAPTLAGQGPRAGSADALASVDLSTGAAEATLPFLLPKARGNAQPSLALRYNSSAGLGFAGVGWTLEMPSVVRRGAAGFPKFIDDVSGTDPFGDRYEFSGAALVPICTVAADSTCVGAQFGEKFPTFFAGWTYFRTEIDSGMRFFWSPDRRTWLAQTKSGQQLQFGVPLDAFGTEGLEHADALFIPKTLFPNIQPGNTSDIFRWNLVRQSDSFNFDNTVYYLWQNLQTSTDGNARGIQYLTDVYDTPPVNPNVPSVFDLSLFLHHVHLRWSKDDLYGPLLAQSPIWNQPPAQRLLGVDVTTMPLGSTGPRHLVRRYHLDYTLNAAVTRAYLSTFQLEGTCGNVSEDSSGLLPDTNCDTLPATTMTYDLSPFSATATIDQTFGEGTHSGPVTIFDVGGTALPNRVDGQMAISGNPNGNPYPGNDVEGFPVMESRNPPPTQRVAELADIAPGSQKVVIGDWLGDGRPNALWLHIDPFDPVDARYEIYSIDSTFFNFALQWLGQGPFPLPKYFSFSGDWQTGRAIDADGDGLVDMAFVPYEIGGSPFRMATYFSARDVTGVVTPFALVGAPTCPAAGMFAHEQASPFSFATVADMDGDGLPDIVVMEPATVQGHAVLDVHYMKNRGDGRFGVGAPGGRSCENFANQPMTEHLDAQTTFNFPMFQFSNVALHDIDGDGVADLVIASSSGVKICQRSPFIGLVPHTGCVQIDPKDLGWPAADVAKFQPQDVALLFADVDASGVDDLIVLAFGGSSIIRTHGGTHGAVRPGLLQRISNGMGTTTSIQYDSVVKQAAAAKAAGKPWNTTLPRPAQVVTGITTTNNLPAPLSQTYQTNYSYQDPVYDARDRSFLGFRSVITQEPGDSAAPGLITTTTFVTDTCPGIARPGAACTPMADYKYRMRRKLPAVIQDDEDSQGQTHLHLTTTVNAYEFQELYAGIDGRRVRNVFLHQTDAYLWDPNEQGTTQSTVPVMVTQDENQHEIIDETISVPLPNNTKHLRGVSRRDSFGNEIAAVDFGELGVDTPILVARQWGLPANDPTGWNYRTLSQFVSYADSTGRVPEGDVRETDLDYNSQGLPTSVAAPLKGTLPLDRSNGGRPVAPPPADASMDTPPGSPLVLSTLAYDGFGNIIQSETPNGRCTGIQYDSQYSLFPTQTSIYRTGCGVDPLTVNRTFDSVLERLIQELNQANQLTAMKYDGFGRLIEIDQPDDHVPGKTAANPAVLIDYSQAGAGPVSKFHIQQISGTEQLPTYDERWTYTDGFGRTLFTLSGATITQQWGCQGRTDARHQRPGCSGVRSFLFLRR
jgi:YD repeat-containing protein